MIGRLAGRIEHRGSDHVLIDVRGVGYVVQVSERTLAALPPVGQAAALWTELLVREDALTLVGFPTLQEKEWHRLLMTVQGVGSKAAMAILGTLGPEGVGRALAIGDWAAIKAAPGVGPKIAQRVVMELKDKAHVVMALGAAAEPAAPAPDDAVIEAEPAAPAAPRAAPAAGAPAQSEALSALTNLGYGPSEAASAVARAAGDLPGAETPALIRAALKLLAPKG
ncbi:Holliday junction branch migration protein RuvA [Frigidibacter sp. ROC022]|uniref:Holliday junction branch migration protein RuvA n=1 Tax=Frigidibacter sp. ROC022 TaxID=2971796 RepID=UPI00215B1B6B|nr:Holliday junction branch migration protein RuvA [Frigidibacter sp. ROC022]MCR8725133.1 Holliday junction branch migration protein RuvA [Frigidibacter sp. ROC022]